MIPLLFFFGICFFGFGDCNETEYSQKLDVILLEVHLNQLEVTMDDYIGDGCLQKRFNNPTTTPDNPDGYPDNYGKIMQSQGWYEGKIWNNLNGTLLTQTYCSTSVWNVFEVDGQYEQIDFEKGDVYYDGEWLRLKSNYVELDRYGYPAEWERNYDNCLKFDDYPECPEELIEQRLQIKVIEN